MSNFFSDIKSWLNADYGGRYFALILRELLRQHPNIIFELSPNIINNHNYIIEKEHFFTDFREADLAILDESSSVIHALIEIKHEDEKVARNHAQLDDYLSFCVKRKIPFLFITKNNPLQRDLLKIEKHKSFAKHIRYSEIFTILDKLQNKSPISEMVQNHIQEEAIVFDNKISKEDILLLVLKGAHVKHFHGLGKQHSYSGIEKAGKTLQSLIKNTSLMGQEFHNKFCKDSYKQSPTVDFCFKPQFNQNLAKKYLDEDIYVDQDAIDGGKLYIWNWYNLKDRKLQNGKMSEKWYGGIEFGFEIILDTKKTEALRVNLYSYISIKDIDEDFYEPLKINIERIDEKEMFSKIVGLNKITIKQCMSWKDCPIGVKSKLKKIYKGLSV